MNYLFGLVDSPAPELAELSGWHGAPLRCVPHGELAGVVCDVRTADLPADEAHLWQHEAVVEALMARHTVLPVRFGVYLREETAVVRLLAEQYETWLVKMARLHGCVELSVRLVGELPVAEPAPLMVAAPTGSGRAYLQRQLAKQQSRLADEAAAERLFGLLNEHLAPLAEEWQTTFCQQALVPITAVYLVRREQVEAFRLAVKENGRLLSPNLQLLCTGPWPPYHFVQTAHE